MNREERAEEKEKIFAQIKAIKYKRKSPITDSELANRLNISLSKLRYITATEEERIKIKNNQKKFREKRKATELNALKEKVDRFKKRAPYTIEYNYLDVIKHFGPNPICYLTGLPVDYNNSKTYQLDHFIPVTKQGTSDLDNMRLAHPMANEMKRDYDFEKFLEICRLITEKHTKN